MPDIARFVRLHSKYLRPSRLHRHSFPCVFGDSSRVLPPLNCASETRRKVANPNANVWWGEAEMRRMYLAISAAMLGSSSNSSTVGKVAVSSIVGQCKPRTARTPASLGLQSLAVNVK